MYSRSFYPPEGALPAVPESYDGVRFVENNEPQTPAPVTESEVATEVVSAGAPAKTEQSGSILSGLFSGGIFGSGGFLSDIGIEEILIIAVAAFLFLSNDGDMECAIMLILLLFIAK